MKNSGDQRPSQTQDQSLQQAVAHHRAGRLPEAERLYRAILEEQPRHPDANHNLGVLTLQAKRPADALPHFEAALEANPDQGQYWLSYIDALIQTGRTDDARTALAQGRQRGLQGEAVDALEGRLEGPSSDEINTLLALLDCGRYAEGEALARRLTERFPRNGFGWKMLGAVIKRQGRRMEALEAIQKAVVLLPQDAEAHSNLGNILWQQGRFAEAEASYRRAIAIKPDYADAHYNLGNALHAQGRIAEAETCYRRALTINPDYAEAHSNLGVTLKDQGRLAEAEASYRRALTIKPDYADTHNNLGNVLLEQGRPEDAEISCRRALTIKPDFAEALNNLGNALKEQGRLTEAEGSYRRALTIEPDFAEAYNNLGNTLQEQCRFAEAETVYRRALSIKPDYTEAHNNLLFTINLTDIHAPSYCLKQARDFGLVAAKKAGHVFSSWPCEAQPQRLRVGLVSGDLRNHPVGYFLEALIPHLDPARIELIAYPTVQGGDDLTARLRPFFAAGKPLLGQSDEAAARMIRADGIHILLDLSGHTRHNRLPLFAWKPAPVQATWLGYFATTGLKEMDYLLGDPYVTPAGEEDHFTETVWRLPECYACFTPPDTAVEVGPLPALSAGCVTFGCFNNLTKMNDAVVALWSRVLTAVPGSRLFLKTKQLNDPAVCDAVCRRFAARGIAPERLMLEGASPRGELLAAYNRVDIALDPFPYPGGVTSMEALWMGAPVITRRGDRFLSHVGEGIAHNTGMADWIAADDDDYVSKAVLYTKDLKRLAKTRAGLRRQVLASPVFDSPRFARHVEEAFWGMWEKWIAAHPVMPVGRMDGPSPDEINTLVALFNHGRYAEGEPLARRLTERFPQDGVGWKALGVALTQQGRGMEALEPMLKAVELAPEDPEAHSNLGNTLQEQGRLKDAEACYRRALAIKPDFAEAHSNLGNALKEQGRLTDAEASYLRALSIRPDYAEACNNLGVTLLEEGRLTDAEAVCRRALSIRPNYAEACNNLGNTLKAQGRLSEAEAGYRRALEIKPDYVEAHSNLGNTLREQGRLMDAEACYRRVLEIKPDFAEEYSNLGNILQEQGRLTDAEECYRRALAIKPDYPEAQYNFGNTLREQGRLADAEACYRRAIEIKADYPEAHNNLGNILQELGRLSDAEDCYHRALSIRPDYAEAHNNLGNTLREQDRITDAEECYLRALSIKPDYAEAHSNLGNILREQGRLADAEECYRRALAINPHYAEAHNNLGNAFKERGRLADAEECYRRALAIKPDYAEAHCNLGNILREKGRLKEAEAGSRRALAIKPDYAEAHNNLANALQEQGRLAEAEAAYRRALALKPDYVEAHSNLGHALQEQGRLTEAEACCRRAIAIKPDFAEAHNNLGNTLQDQGRIAEAETAYRRALKIKPDYNAAHSNLLFALNYTDHHTSSYCLKQASHFGRIVEKKTAHVFSSWPCEAKPKCLRIGLVSGDMRNHPVGFFLEALIPHIDPARIELIAYPAIQGGDDLTARLKPGFAAWKPLAGLSDEAAARLIRADGIHVLLDLSGHTSHNRLPLFAWKPAPVQATWLGYFATTGLKEMDYLLGDPYVTPAGEEDHFTETVWRLPECYACFTPPDTAVEVGPLPALSAGCVTFGCFNNLTKMNDAVVALWSRVLTAVPGSRLFLKTKQLNDPAVCDAVCRRFAARGIAPERLMLEGASPRGELLAAYNRVDIALDPFPYPGGVTSMEALWMGVPVITRRGDRFLSHVGEGIANNTGMADWIAADDDDYVSKAVLYTKDLKRLAKTRAGLRRQVLVSPVFDSPRFARHVEEALWGMWKKWFAAHPSMPADSNDDPPSLNTDRTMNLIQPASAVRLDGPSPDEINTLVALFNEGRYAEEELLARRLTKRYPRDGFVWKGLATALRSQGRGAEALEAVQKAVELAPGDAEAHSNLGNTLQEQGRLAEAEAHCRRALTIRPDFVEALNNLGVTLQELGRLSEAEACYLRALTIRPDFAAAHYNLGNTLQDEGRLTDAEASYRRAFEIRPDALHHAISFHLLLPVIMESLEEIAHWRKRYQEGIEALMNVPGSLEDPGKNVNPLLFYLAYHNLNDRPMIEALHRFFRTRLAGLTAEAPHVPSWQPPRASGRRIRVGFLSELLRNHTIGKLNQGFIRHLDRNRFEVVVIHTSKTIRDAFSQNLDALADTVVNLPAGLKSQQQAVAAQKLDVLFYPDIGMAPSTYFLAYARLAPVQAASLGHPDTSGLDTIDYFVSSSAIEPEDADEYYTERLIRLSRVPFFYQPLIAPGEIPSRASLGLPETGTLYGCPQSLFKFHPDFDAVLAAIAEGDPTGRIVLLEGKHTAWSDLLKTRWSKTFPVLLERVLFLPMRPLEGFMALMALIDVLLDPIHFGGGNTLYEAMVYGTPFVTWPGRFMRGRIVAAAYRQMGIADAPIANRLEEYAPLALALGRDPERRRALRQASQEAANRELFADMRAVREFEAFLEAAVAAAGRGEKLPVGWRPDITK